LAGAWQLQSRLSSCRPGYALLLGVVAGYLGRTMADDNVKQFRFRIIAGSLKGREIVAPNLGITRPPLTRLRKSVFDFLSPYVRDCAYLDLYSGTGSYLFEAVSRGATEAVGVEMEERLVGSICQQAADFKIDDRLSCVCDDVFEAIPRLSKEGKRFDIIMMAPPQYQRLVEKTLQTLRDYPVLAKDGLLLCQHESGIRAKIDFKGWEVWQQRKYGNTTFSVCRWGE